MRNKNSLIDQLDCRVDVYSKQKIMNQLNEIDFEYQRKHTVWANIRPISGKQISGQAETKYAEISHKFTLRKKAASALTTDMYFIFQGQRYDIKYFIPNYQLKDRVEVYCSLVVE